MIVQYIYNENGEKESVIIPYKEWEKIHSTIKKERSEDFDPDEYRGIYKGLKLNLDEEIKNLRDEWSRIDT
jgi:hypothetical protein